MEENSKNEESITPKTDANSDPKPDLAEPAPAQSGDTDSVTQPQESNELTSRPLMSLLHTGALITLVTVGVGFLYLLWRHKPTLPKTEPQVQLIVVQLNDIYRLDAVRAGKRGGLARVVTVLRQLKSQNPNVPIIVVHAGDFLAPSLESNVFHGVQMIDAMNFIHDIAPLYVVPGNHEFDYSSKDKEYLTNAIIRSRFQWIAANIDKNNSVTLPALRDKVPGHFVVTEGRVKLGIFGLTIDNAHEGQDRDYAPILGDYAAVATREIEQLLRDEADVVIGLTHLNMDDDRKLAQLKQQHPAFVWIAGGHEHALDREPGSANSALITKGDSNARTIWKVSVMKVGEKVELREESIKIDETIQPDTVFVRDVEDFYRYKLRKERPYLDNVIASQLNRCYDGTEEAVRERESDWGNLLTDNMRAAYKKFPADVAVLNGGSIRIDDTICDTITFENLERTFAFPTPIVLVRLTGKNLREQILENSVNSGRGEGRFLQVSGVSFRRDASEKGILKNLQLQTAKGVVPFDDNKTYVVAVNEYIFDCGDKYEFRKFVTEYIPAGPDLRALVYTALNQKKPPSKNPQPLGRIIDLPSYAFPSTSNPEWKTLSNSDRACPVE